MYIDTRVWSGMKISKVQQNWNQNFMIIGKILYGANNVEILKTLKQSFIHCFILWAIIKFSTPKVSFSPSVKNDPSIFFDKGHDAKVTTTQNHITFFVLFDFSIINNQIYFETKIADDIERQHMTPKVYVRMRCVLFEVTVYLYVFGSV